MNYQLAGVAGPTTVPLISGAVNIGSNALIAHEIAVGAMTGPVGAAIAGAVAIATLLITSLFKPNLEKIAASNDANQIELLMKENLHNWLSVPTDHKYASIQQAALNNFDAAWGKYLQLVQPLLKKAPNSISDRQQGSCAYHVAQPYNWIGGNYVPAGTNQPTGNCWNWFTGYRDPIANDPYVIPDNFSANSASGSSIIPRLVSGGTGLWLGLMLVAGGLLYASNAN